MRMSGISSITHPLPMDTLTHNSRTHTYDRRRVQLNTKVASGIHTIYFFPAHFHQFIPIALVCIVRNLTELSAHQVVLPSLVRAENALNKIVHFRLKLIFNFSFSNAFGMLDSI